MQPKAANKKPHVIVEQFRLADEPHRSRRILFGYSDEWTAQRFLAEHIKQIKETPLIVTMEDGPRVVPASNLRGRDRAEYLKANEGNTYGNGTAVFYPHEPIAAPLEA